MTGDVAEFHATDWAADDSLRQTIDNACIAPRVLQLKPGAQVPLLLAGLFVSRRRGLTPPSFFPRHSREEDPQVMLLRNLDATHVNGSRGVVVSIDEAVSAGSRTFAAAAPA